MKYGLFLSTALLSQLTADINEFHETVSVKENLSKEGKHFNLFVDDAQIGCVCRKQTSLTPQYSLLNTENTQVAKANMRFFGNFVVFDVTDKNGAILGSIHEKLCTFYPKFKIVTLQGDNVAEATLNIWRTTWTISDPDTGITIATLHRPFFRLSNHWDLSLYQIETFNEKPIHPHLFYTLLAIQSDKDYWGDQENFFEISYSQELLSLAAIYENAAPSILDCVYAECLAKAIEDSVDDTLPDPEKYSNVFGKTLKELESENHTESQKAALDLILLNTLSFVE